MALHQAALRGENPVPASGDTEDLLRLLETQIQSPLDSTQATPAGFQQQGREVTFVLPEVRIYRIAEVTVRR